MTLAQYQHCLEHHHHKGTIGYPLELTNLREAHMSVRTCGSPECVASANRAIRKVTGHDGVYLSFVDARARRGAA